MPDQQPRDLRIPLPGGEDIRVSGRFPITQARWDFFLSVLEAMKPGLVSDIPSFFAPPAPMENSDPARA